MHNKIPSLSITAKVLIFGFFGLGILYGQPIFGAAQNMDLADKTDSDLTQAPKPFNVVVLQLNGYFLEKPGANLFDLSQTTSTNLTEFTETMRKAAADETVGAVVLNFEQPLLNWAYVDELRRHIRLLRYDNS